MASEIVTTSGTAKVVMITGENGLDSVAGHPAQTAGKRWRSVVFTRSCGVNDLGWRELTEVTVGEFDDAGAAWEKAKDAAKPGGTFGYTIIPVDPSGMETIADAEKIVAAARLDEGERAKRSCGTS